MIAKCNITNLVIEEISSLFYGIKCKDNSCAIIENYIESLNCPVNLVICNPADCKNDPITFRCQFNIVRTSVVVTGNTVVFSLSTEDYVGGTAPFTYSWNFEEEDFIASGSINTNQLTLIVQPGKSIELLVSSVTLSVTDTNGCQDSKTCWLNKGVLKCSVNFIPCVNPTNLIVVNGFVNCVSPSGLIVTEL